MDVAIPYEAPLSPVEFVQAAAPGPYPEIAVPVLNDRRHEIAAKALRIFRNVFIDFEVIAVIPIKPVPGAEPHKALFITQDTRDIVRRQTGPGA